MYKVLLGYLAVACLLWYIASFRIHTKKRQSRRIFNDELNVTNHEQQYDLEPGFTYHQQQKVFNFADNFSKANETPAHEEQFSANLSLVVQSGSSHVVQPTTAPSCQGGCTKAQRPPGPRVFAAGCVQKNDGVSPPLDLPELPPPLDSEPNLSHKKLGSGGFGCVYKGEMNSVPVAVKVVNKPPENFCLQYEAKVLCALQQVESNESSKAAKIPELIDFRTVEGMQVMTTQLLYKDLQKVEDGKGVAQENIGHYAEQIFMGLKNMHQKGHVVHCDIKPENLMVGFPGTLEEKQVYFVDFGLARLISKSKEIQKTTRQILGTYPYMTERALRGEPRGFKHDVIAAVYTLLRIVRRVKGGSVYTAELPWERVPTDAKDLREQVDIMLDNKGKTSNEQLCEGLHPEIANKFQRAYDLSKEIEKIPYDKPPEYEAFVRCFQ